MLFKTLAYLAAAILLALAGSAASWGEDGDATAPTAEASTAELVASLGSRDGAERRAARMELSQRISTRDDATDITEALVRALYTGDLLTVGQAEDLLEDRIQQLQKRIADIRSEVRRRAAKELERLMELTEDAVAEGGIFGSRAAANVAASGMEVYAEALEENRRQVRRKGVRGLGEAASLYADLLTEPRLRARARRHALNLLEDLVDIIQDALKDRDQRTRLAGLRVAEDLAEELTWVLVEGDARARSLVRSLIERIRELLDDPEPRVRRAAESAVSKLPDL